MDSLGAHQSSVITHHSSLYYVADTLGDGGPSSHHSSLITHHCTMLRTHWGPITHHPSLMPVCLPRVAWLRLQKAWTCCRPSTTPSVTRTAGPTKTYGEQGSRGEEQGQGEGAHWLSFSVQGPCLWCFSVQDPCLWCFSVQGPCLWCFSVQGPCLWCLCLWWTENAGLAVCAKAGPVFYHRHHQKVIRKVLIAASQQQ